MASSQRPAIVILGASARALARSAARAGWAVHAADLFGDVDLVAAAVASRRVTHYPDALVAAAASFPPAAWLYGGALENHPDLIDTIAAVRPLAGNGGAAVRRVRDPALLGAALRAAGLRFPETHSTPVGLPTDGSFLVKPRASAGGRGIAQWHGPDSGAEPAAARVWQRFVDGEPLAAAYLLQEGRAILLAVSRQFVGEPWCHARPFAYCGSVAVAVEQLPDTTRDQLARLGALLAETFGLVGLVGVDLVVDAAGDIAPVEVNPRPTASMELVERATGESIAALHLGACGFASPATVSANSRADACWTKAVLFAPCDVAVDDRLLDAVAALADGWTIADGWPAIADIPQPGQTIDAGRPVLTIFAVAAAPEGCRQRLMHRVETLSALIAPALPA